ncbi:MAG: ABC transporter substrate-binding protein [Alphaproteobacteria bacterium]|nr:ABC transporter substrate-binding protein [Alphaproteobacteria bacterium]
MPLRSRLFAALATAFVALATPAMAQKSADTLRVTWRDGIPVVDPYYNSLRIGLIVAHQAWDGLVGRDPESFAVRPLLAESWQYTDPTTIEFKLRANATFHDGSPVTADDVVYTINSLPTDKKVSVPSNYAWIAGAEKIDTHTVRVKLKRVFPAALEYLVMVTPIWPKAYRERVGEEAYAKAPVGAGPYRITKVDGVHQIVMERYEGYHAGGIKPKAAIRNLVINSVTDSSAEITALLGNKADFIWNFPSDNFDNINRIPTLIAMRAESMRVGYLSIDAAGRTAAGNPLTNLKVRQAIHHAIDRLTIADKLVQGGSRVPEAPCYPSQFGCDGKAAVAYAYDPAKAKALLAEAGYPNGFDIELVTYILPQWSAAVQNYLKAVGINARISQLQASAALQRSIEGKNPLYLGSWGSYSINDVSALMPFFFTGGGDDYARDAETKTLVDAGGATTDLDERRKNYSAAITRITEQAYWLPLHTYVNTYALTRQLDFKPYPDELPRFYLAKWK